MNLLGRLATGALKRPKVRSTRWHFPIAFVPRLCGPAPGAQVIPSLAIPPCPVYGARNAMAQPHFVTSNYSQPDVEQEIRTAKNLCSLVMMLRSVRFSRRQCGTTRSYRYGLEGQSLS
jgi:hypothetical protein